MACTSGSAGTHFYPAVVEAYQSRTPLVVLTCDRPERLRGTDASQTIDQRNLFGKYTCFRQSLELYRVGHERHLEQILSAMAKILFRERRPVHLNLAYEEPLWEENCEGRPHLLPSISPGKDNHPKGLQPETLALLSRWKRPFLVVGQDRGLPPRALVHWLREVKVPFYVDITSGIKTQVGHLPHSMTSLDSPFVLNYLRDEVDGILHLGGTIVGQNYERMLDGLKRPKVVQLSPHFADRILPNRILHQQRFCHQSSELWGEGGPPPEWNVSHTPLVEYEDRRRKLFAHYPFAGATHYRVVREVYQNLQEGDLLVVGNSTPIRGFNDYYYSQPKDVLWQFQRGASGIEGMVARAKGAARGHGGRVVCVLGDIAAYHDLASLVGPLPKNLKVLILNNHRGGIFSRVPVRRYLDPLEDVVDTPHSLNFSSLCASWPGYADGADSITSFLTGSGTFWEYPIDHQKDMQEWQEFMGR